MKQTHTFTFTLLLFLLVSLGCGKAEEEVIPPPPLEENGDQWVLDFEENFDGNTLNTNVWSPYNTPGHVGNGLRRAEAFSVEDGLLVVTAKNNADGAIVSGGMRHKADYLYGKFEFKVKSDRDPAGIMSAVVLTWPSTEKWPVDGELDIFETGPGIDRNNFFTVIHYDPANKQYTYDHKINGREWRIMTMEWTPEYIRIYRDGQKVYELTDLAAIPRVSHHICIQLDASKNGQLLPETKMYVDWVKIYKYNKK
jgi:beta-glucanase (GH16 family)